MKIILTQSDYTSHSQALEAAPEEIQGDAVTSSPIPDTNDADVFSYIDGYCERESQPGIFSEPLNLITNLAFIIGAILLFRLFSKTSQLTRKNWDIIALATLIGVIGLGSAAYHSFPNGTTVNMDVIPIGIFIHLYIVVFLMRVIRLKAIPAIIVLVAFIVTGIIFQKNFPPHVLNGTIMYVPTYLMLIIMVFLLCFVRQSPLYVHLINTAVIWTFSLAFRTIDMQICSHTNEIGTHFLWHILNAIVLYRLVVLIISSKAPNNLSAGQESS